jgi:hypothetical protein
MRTFYLTSLITLLGSVSGHAGQGRGGGDAICEMVITSGASSRLSCQLADLLEWGAPEPKNPEYPVTANTFYIFRNYRNIINVNTDLIGVYVHGQENFGLLQILTGQNEDMFGVLPAIESSPGYVEKRIRIFASSDSLWIAANIVNRLHEISKFAPCLGEVLKKKFLTMQFLPVNSELIDIADEGASYLKTPQSEWKQGAIFDENFVRISLPIMKAMRDGHKMALFFHEVTWSIAKDQGDKTSERARKVNGFIFRADSTGGKFKAAEELLFPNQTCRYP